MEAKGDFERKTWNFPSFVTVPRVCLSFPSWNSESTPLLLKQTSTCWQQKRKVKEKPRKERLIILRTAFKLLLPLWKLPWSHQPRRSCLSVPVSAGGAHHSLHSPQLPFLRMSYSHTLLSETLLFEPIHVSHCTKQSIEQIRPAVTSVTGLVQAQHLIGFTGGWVTETTLASIEPGHEGKKIKRDTKVTTRSDSRLYASIGTVLRDIPLPKCPNWD